MILNTLAVQGSVRDRDRVPENFQSPEISSQISGSGTAASRTPIPRAWFDLLTLTVKAKSEIKKYFQFWIFYRTKPVYFELDIFKDSTWVTKSNYLRFSCRSQFNKFINQGLSSFWSEKTFRFNFPRSSLSFCGLSKSSFDFEINMKTKWAVHEEFFILPFKTKKMSKKNFA